MRHLSAVLILVCCSVSVAVADIEVIRDRASGDTTIKTSVRGATATPHISLYAIVPASTKDLPTVALLLSARFPRWHYRQCHRTGWRVDNTLLELPQPSYDGKMGEGFVAEFLTIQPLTIGQVRQMAQATTIAFTICDDEFTASPEEMQDFRTFMDKVREQGGK